MAKLGNVNLTIKNESLTTSVEATNFPVEKGVPFTDHVKEKPWVLSIDGVIVGNDYKTKLQQLRESMRKGDILTYVGRTVAKNIIILDINDNQNAKVGNGSEVNIKLQFVRLVENSWSKANSKDKSKQKPVSKSGKKQVVSKKSNNEVYHQVKSGETYYSLAKKYGTTVAALKKLNKWPDTGIPVGARMRIR